MVDIALEGARLNAILIAAIELRLFDAVAGESLPISEIADRADISVRGCQAIADGLVGLRIWRVTDGLYCNTPGTEKLLRSDSDDYIGDHQPELFKYWMPIFSDVARFAKTGKPPHAIDSDETKYFWSQLTPMLAKKAGNVAIYCYQTFDMQREGARLLDIGGGGSALYASTILVGNESATATQIDWPHINDAAAARVAEVDATERFSRVDGDFHDVDFGTDEFDYVVMSNIIHQESSESVGELIARCAKSLRRGGRLIVSDWIVDEGRTGPNPSLFFNFTMLLLSSDGKTYERSEVAEMYEKAGLSGIEFLKTDDYETIATAVKS